MGNFKKDYTVATAKTPAELDKTYDKLKAKAPSYGFGSVAALKSDVVKKAMTDSKKQADFIVRVQGIEKKGLILDLLCDVNGKMSSVISRKEIKSMADYDKAKGLADFKDLKKQVATLGIGGL